MMTAETLRNLSPSVEAQELRPPSRWQLLGEGRIVFEGLALTLALPRLRATAASGDGAPVLVVPGFATDDGWTSRLRQFLLSLGYATVGWGLGRNHGRVPELIPALVEQVAAVSQSHEQPIRLIGWSLGGYLAREVARERPDLVERVITLGAPVIGGPAYTASAPMYKRRGYDLAEIEAAVAAREAEAIEVPVFAVYSRSDGIVAWRACIDRFDNPRVEHHEVRSSHLGLVRSPQVYRLVAELLARPL